MRWVPPGRVRQLYRTHFAVPRRELLFLSGLSFFATFGVTRVVTGLAPKARPPGKHLRIHGVHIHHQVFGILMLIGSGHAWLHLASLRRRDDRNLLRLNTLFYGVGSALTLDELALWLNLEDVYWKRPWRELIDAGVVAISLGSIGAWGAPFFRALAKEATAAADRAAMSGRAPAAAALRPCRTPRPVAVTRCARAGDRSAPHSRTTTR